MTRLKLTDLADEKVSPEAAKLQYGAEAGAGRARAEA